MESKDEKPAPLSDEFSQSLKDLTMECLSFDPGSRPDAHKIFRQAEEQLAIVQSQPVTKARLMSHKKGQLLPGASIASTTWPGWHFRVYFQDSSGGVREAKHDVGVWTGGDRESAIFKAKLFTPLAVVSNKDGKEIRVFSLTEENMLQEYCYTARHGWRPGSLNKLKIEAAQDSKITAVWQANGFIHLYYQTPVTDDIQEYHWHPSTHRFQRFRCWPTSTSTSNWQKGETLNSDALRGTSLAAATWGQDSIRVYFQNTALELREQCRDSAGGGWYIGHVAVGVMPKHTSITAMAWLGEHSGIQIRVYWHDPARHLFELKWDGGWNPAEDLDFIGITVLSVVQWSDGDNIRLYFQSSDHAIREKCFSSGGWYNGSRVDQITPDRAVG